MLKCELKKLFFKRKILLLVAAVLVLEILLALRMNPVSQTLDTEQYARYQSALSAYAGKITAQTGEEITQRYLDASGAESKLEALSEQLAADQITREEYQTQADVLYQLQGNLPAEAALYTAYTAAYENPDRVWLMPDNAWKLIFENSSADWLMIFFVLILSITAVKTETQSSMDLYNRTAKYGRGKLAMVKICTIMLTVFVLSVAVSALRLGILTARFGAEGWDFPLASVEIFRFSGIQMSVLEGFFTVTILKACGYAYTAALALLLAVFFKNVPTAACVAGITLLPEFIAAQYSDASLLYRYSLPVAFMKAMGFLQGSTPEQYSSVFTALSGERKIAVLAISTGILLVCLLISGLKLSGTRVRFPKRTAVIALILPVLFFSSCSPRENTNIQASSRTDTRYVFVMGSIYDKQAQTIVPSAVTPFVNHQVLGIYGDYALVAAQ